MALAVSPTSPLPPAVRKPIWQRPVGSLALPGNNPETAAIAQQTPPRNVLARMAAISDPLNLSQTLTLETMEAAVRQAERGDVWQLFTLYRDCLLSSAHIKSVWNVRKMAVVGQPAEYVPASDSAEDQRASDVIKQMVEGCDNWDEGLIHILNGQLYPCSVTEKIFDVPKGNEPIPVRFILKRLYPVSEFLQCFKIPYLPQPSQLNNPRGVFPPAVPSVGSYGNNPALIYNEDDWEADLRLYDTFPNGMINRNVGAVYRPDPMRHFIFHGSPNSASVRDNYGGELRSILPWYFFSTLGRSAFARMMENFGHPIPVVWADMQQADTLAWLTQAFNEMYTRHALILDHKTSKGEIQTLDTKTESLGQSYNIYLEYCEGQITRLILGQELSSKAKSTGMNSGNAKLQGEVRRDIKVYDASRLNHALKTQLFQPYLDMNGIGGKPPTILFGGIDEEEIEFTCNALQLLSQAGLEPTDDSIPAISKRLGFELQRKEIPEPTIPGKPPGKPTSPNAK